MLDLVETDYQALRLIRNCDNEMLNSISISEEKEVSDLEFEGSHLPSLNSSFPDQKSLEFSVVKKWTSPRLKSVTSNSNEKLDDLEISSCDIADSPKTRIKHKILNSHGDIEGVKIGDWWNSRLECSYAGVHRPTIASVHSGRDGIYSIALSNCLDDSGLCFIFTGSGNQKNSRIVQPKNQIADGCNISFMKSIETKNPVRVIRGYKLNSAFAPLRGYRYDGLYSVEKFWTCKKASGSVVFKFLMKRCENQPPAPWEFECNHSKNHIHSMKKSPSRLDRAMDNSVGSYQTITQSGESPRESEASSYADDNKENSTLNIADRLLCDEFTDSSIFSSSDFSLPRSKRNIYRKNKRSNKRRLPRQNKSKRSFKKLCERSVKIIDEKTSDTEDSANTEPSELFRGFNTEFYPRKIILLGFLIHDMQSKLLKNQSA